MTGRPLLLAALVMLSLSGCAGGYYERYDTYGSGYYGYPGGWGNRGFSGPYYSGRGWRGPGWRRPPPQNFHGRPPGRGGRQNRGSHWRH